jgi:hypothetical protein
VLRCPRIEIAVRGFSAATWESSSRSERRVRLWPRTTYAPFSCTFTMSVSGFSSVF